MSGLKRSMIILAMIILVMSGSLWAGGDQEAAKEDATVRLAVFGDQGHNLVPFEWIEEEAAEMGIELEVIGVPFTAVYEKLKTEFVGGTGAYDLVVFYPSYLGEFAEFGYLQPLDKFFGNYDPDIDDIVPAYKDLYCSYAGDIYALPYDGDVLNFYYRRDLFDDAAEKAAFQAAYGRTLEVPETWDEALEVAEFFTRSAGESLMGKPLDQDMYGFSFLGTRGFAYGWWLNIFGAMGGAYFDRNMNPQINSQAGIDALNMLAELKRFSPPDVMNMGYEELKNAFLHGQLATMVQWSDIWKKANDASISHIVGNCGVAQMPGMVQADGSILRRAAGPVGRVIGIPTTTKHAEEAYWVAWKLTTDISLETVSTSATGLDPYRYSHVENAAAFEEFGPAWEAEAYLSAVMDNLGVLYPDLNIPGAAEYLDTLDIAVTSALSGTISAKQALDEAAVRWDQTTDTLGREKQTKIFNNMLDIWAKYGFWED